MRAYSDWPWHLDEAFVKINGEMHYLWRANDHEGECGQSEPDLHLGRDCISWDSKPMTGAMKSGS